jgi:chromosome segregation ATPase
MDLNQLTRMIEWLDEERRRDKAKIAQMEELITQQQDYVEAMTRRMNGLEGDQTSMRSMFVPAGRDNEIMDFLRGEIQQAVEVSEGKRITAEREAERRSELAREAMMRPVRELGDRLEKLEHSQDELTVARVERDRIASALAALQQRVEDVAKRFEEPERRLSFLEEQRRQDSRRISETQTELPEIQKQIDALKPKLDLLESLALRNEKLVLDLQSGDRERVETVQTFIEQQTLLAQQRDQRVEEIRQGFGQYEDELRKRFERFETWAEAYRQMKKIVEDFERIGERLERRINEVAEMQRLSEERFRQEWNSWNIDDQKRWKQFTLTNDEAWRVHDKEFEQVRARMNELSAQFNPIQESLDRLWRMMRAQIELYRDRMPALLAEFEQAPERTGRTSNGSGSAARTSQTMRAVTATTTSTVTQAPPE